MFILQAGTPSLPRACSTSIALIFCAGGVSGGLSPGSELAGSRWLQCPGSGSHRVPGDSQRCSGGTGDTAQPPSTVERRWFCVCLVAAANLVLHQTVERIHVGKKYGDIPRGIFVVRGENVVLLGEIVSAPVPLLGGFVVGWSVCLL